MVYIFLQGWRATLIPLLAVPVSLIGTFIVFPMLGFSINTLSLFGLVLAIGLVVDDAIVVVEAVEHHIEQGMTPHDATVKAMEEVSGPVIAIALILAAVFIPTAFVPGITGQLYKQFAVTIAISVLFSAFNALTLSPALSAMLLRPKKEARGPLGAFFRWFNKVFGRATDGYVGACQHLIHKAGFAFLLLGVLIVGAGFFGKKIPSSFLPDEDQGYLYAGLQLPDASSLQRSSEAAREVEKIIMDTPGVQYVSSVMGYSMLSGVNATYSSFFFISFKPWDERKTPETSYDGIKAHLQQALSQVPVRHCILLSAAGHSGRGNLGRRHLHSGRPLGQRHRLSRQEHADLHGRGPQASGAGRRDDHRAVRRAAGRRQRRQRQGHDPADSVERPVPDDADVHGRLADQLLQPLRPAVAGVRPGRRRLPHQGRESGQVLRAERRRRDGSAEHA